MTSKETRGAKKCQRGKNQNSESLFFWKTWQVKVVLYIEGKSFSFFSWARNPPGKLLGGGKELETLLKYHKNAKWENRTGPHPPPFFLLWARESKVPLWAGAVPTPAPPMVGLVASPETLHGSHQWGEPRSHLTLGSLHWDARVTTFWEILGSVSIFKTLHYLRVVGRGDRRKEEEQY